MRKGKYNLSDIAFPSSIQRAVEDYKVKTPAVRAIQNASFIGKQYKPGDKALLVPLKKAPRGYPPMDVIMIDDEKDLPKGFEIDYDTIIDKSIRMKVEDILPAMGLTFEEVVSGRKQSTLW
jgi:DNA polymerase I